MNTKALKALRRARTTLLHGETFEGKYYDKCAVAAVPWEVRYSIDYNHKVAASMLLDGFSVDEINQAEKGL